MHFWRFIQQDRTANAHNTKGRFVTLCFRLAQYTSIHPLSMILLFPHVIFYKLFFEWMLGFELPRRTRVGKGLTVFHIQCVVINAATVIGEHVTLRHGCTIGNKQTGGASPVIGNYVNIGAHACILGDIVIGDQVVIGAGSIVTKSVPSNCTVAGNPARIVRTADIPTPL